MIPDVTTLAVPKRPRRRDRAVLTLALTALVAALGAVGACGWLAARNTDLAGQVTQARADAATATDRAGTALDTAQDLRAEDTGALADKVTRLEAVTNGMMEAIRQLGADVDALGAPAGDDGIDWAAYLPLLEGRISTLERDLRDVCQTLDLDLDVRAC